VVARIKAGIPLPDTGQSLPDGSRISYLNTPAGKKSDQLPVRVAEHNVILLLGDGEQVSGTCTLATTLLDHRLVSAEQIRDAYTTRWTASETTPGPHWRARGSARMRCVVVAGDRGQAECGGDGRLPPRAWNILMRGDTSRQPLCTNVP
jgi:hypothetical protein